MRLLLSDPKEDNGINGEQTLQFDELSYCCNKGIVSLGLYLHCVLRWQPWGTFRHLDSLI